MRASGGHVERIDIQFPGPGFGLIVIVEVDFVGRVISMVMGVTRWCSRSLIVVIVL